MFFGGLLFFWGLDTQTHTPSLADRRPSGLAELLPTAPAPLFMNCLCRPTGVPDLRSRHKEAEARRAEGVRLAFSDLAAALDVGCGTSVSSRPPRLRDPPLPGTLPRPLQPPLAPRACLDFHRMPHHSWLCAACLPVCMRDPCAPPCRSADDGMCAQKPTAN